MSKREFTKFTQHNVVHINPKTEPDESLVLIGSPSSSTTPYDVYARFIHDEAVRCFSRAKISAEVHTCHREIDRLAWGSGPEGSVRFGDRMIPPEIMAVVKTVDCAAAQAAWETYTYRKYAERPHTLSRGKWWDGAQWNTGPTWRMVMENAVAVAVALKLPFARIERIMQRARKDGIVTQLSADEVSPRTAVTA